MTEIEQVGAVLLRYATGIDSRDWTLFQTCFTENCVADYGPIGKWDSCEAITRYMESSHSGPSLHRLSNLAITIDGDNATSRTYVDALVYGPGGIGGAQTIGFYDDKHVRTADGWKISERKFSCVKLKFLGVLAIIPSWLALRLASIASAKMQKRL